MDDRALADIARRLDALERSQPRLRLGVVTDDSPLTITLGGSDTEFADVKSLTTPSVSDTVAVLVVQGDLLVLGTIA